MLHIKEERQMNQNNLVLKYAKANLEMDEAYHICVPPGSRVDAVTTMQGVCGFVIPIHGKALFKVCNENYELKRGTILHAGPDMNLSKEVIGEEEWEFILLHYRVLQEEERIDSLLNMHYIINLFPSQIEEIMKIIDYIMDQQKRYGTRYLLSTKILLYELVEKLFAFSEKSLEKKPKDWIEEVLLYIHEHLEDNLSVSEIAEHFKMGGKQFSYSFQKKIGLPPKRYIMEVQLKKAKELLSESSLSIAEISRRIGYEDALHFSRMFKRSTGIAPSVFHRHFGKNPY
ncbi:MAG: helix-turn-helix transcriptional regulator [Hungatella sp.]|nr:helix-turn-helix transcriptional regulator [Hungatella sp.]